jgi:Kef-type K+ transport system membrane component KefB
VPSLDDFLVVAAIAVGAPLVIGLVPWLPLPSVALEIVGGIVVGPSVLGWVEVDDPIEIFALFGLAFLLLLAGLEIDFDALRGRLLRTALVGFAVSFAIALAAGFALGAADVVKSPLLLAIALASTSLGVVISVLKDAGEISSRFGQLTIAGASVADVLTTVLLSLFFSRESSGLGAKLVLLTAFALLVAAVGIAVVGSQRSMRLTDALVRLQDTSAQIRVRATFLLLVLFVVLAAKFGLEAILGAFMAGAVIKLVDRDEAMTHPRYRAKLDAVGYGVFIPFFFVASGIRFDGHALFSSASTVARVPLFLALLLAARGLAAATYRGLLDSRRTVAAGLLQATSLGFLVVTSSLGVELDLLSEANAAALVAAGLLSVLLFPLIALGLLRNTGPRAETVPA